MIKMYDQFYLVLYNFLKSIERGYKNQTDSARVLSVSLFISFTETCLMFSIFKNAVNQTEYATIFIVLIIFNGTLYYAKSRWKSVLLNKTPSSSSKWITFGIVATCIGTAVFRYLEI